MGKKIGVGQPATLWTEDSAGVQTDVYDNGTDQAIGGGNIVVHTKK